METLHFVVVVLSFVLLSSVLDQMISRVSLPLVQIGIGLLMAVFISGPLEFSLDPELFLVLFIAPLLYDESRNVSKRLLYRSFFGSAKFGDWLGNLQLFSCGFLLELFRTVNPAYGGFCIRGGVGADRCGCSRSLVRDGKT